MAKDDALSLTQTNPRAQEPLQLRYDAAIRVGNALSGMGKAQNDNALKQDALKEYNALPGSPQKIVSMSDDEKSESDVIDAHMKIGDIYKDGDVEQHRQALAEYQSGLTICEAALAKHPDNIDLLRNKGKAFYRIAELKRTEDAFDDSRAFYRKASEVQEALVARNATGGACLAANARSELEIKLGLDLHTLGTSGKKGESLEPCTDEGSARSRSG